MGYSNFSQIFSTIMTIIILSIVIGSPFYISEFIFRNYHERILCRRKRRGQMLTEAECINRTNCKAFNQRFGTLIREFKFYESLNSLMFYPIFLFNRIAYITIQIVFHGSPEVQIPLLIFTTLLVIYIYI